MSIQDEIKHKLQDAADKDYQKFSARLVPGCMQKLGVRIPILRRFAKELAQDEKRYTAYFAYTISGAAKFNEEILLHGLTLGYIKTDTETLLSLVSRYIPLITNWEQSDCCMSIKALGKNKERVWEFLQPYLASEKTYYIRVALILILSFFIEKEYLPEIFSTLDSISHRKNGEDYYVMMAAAWCLSVCYVKLPEQTMLYLQHNELDDKTFNTALQKIRESYRCPQAAKPVLKEMKRKPV
ncbi:MAG: DNA alkylation repair protein [Treponema sp.]|jgi:3-methyladenine DNA glycosylase AlkD|nr:DNA alkylation repair protein [Treponema sp.]